MQNNMTYVGTVSPSGEIHINDDDIRHSKSIIVLSEGEN